MSLVTSSAFQLSPAVQIRAFVSLGTLASSDVDDDLLYQILVAYKTALSQASENDILAVLSMLRCICRVVPASPPQSRYIPQLFWLAVALLQSGLLSCYTEALQLLKATLERMAEQGMFRDRGVAGTLLEGRTPLEEVAIQLDNILGLSFEASFSFSLSAIIFKGIRHAKLRDATADALRTLIRVTVHSCGEVDHADGPGAPICQEILGYFLALTSLSTTPESFKSLLQDADVHESWYSEDLLPSDLDEDLAVKIPHGLLGAADGDDALFVVSFVSAMLSTAQGDDKETEMLYDILAQISTTHPDIISMTYVCHSSDRHVPCSQLFRTSRFDTLSDKVKDAFANTSRPEILSYVSSVFRVAMRDRHRAPAYRTASASTLSTVEEVNGQVLSETYDRALKDHFMQGLPSSFTFIPTTSAQKMINWISELVVKIIE